MNCAVLNIGLLWLLFMMPAAARKQSSKAHIERLVRSGVRSDSKAAETQDSMVAVRTPIGAAGVDEHDDEDVEATLDELETQERVSEAALMQELLERTKQDQAPSPVKRRWRRRSLEKAGEVHQDEDDH